MKNLTDKEFEKDFRNLKELLSYAYKKTPKTKKIKEFDKLRIKLPNQKKQFEIDIQYSKNKKKILSYLFANINNPLFTNKKPNSYAFELLWIILDVLEVDEKIKAKLNKRELFGDIRLYSNLVDLVQFGKYEFAIPKYRRFIFDVKGYGKTILTIV